MGRRRALLIGDMMAESCFMLGGQPLEIRWHGRGGQGAKTAALLFGEAALDKIGRAHV